jgi:PAS domain S-box-containing protein
MAGDEDELRELFEHAPCGYVSTRADGTIVRVNETLLAWIGRSREDVVGTRFQSLLTVAGRIFHDTHYAPLLAMQGAVKEIALDLVRTGKSPLSTVVSSVVRRDDAGVRHLTMISDASDRRSYERELLFARTKAELAIRGKEAMLSTISHEMRSPLGSVLMAADLLAEHVPEEQRRYLQMLERSATTVLELVNAILDHSKLEQGAEHWQETELDLGALLDEIAAIFSLKAEAKRIEFKLSRDPRVPARVRTDGFKLGMVLTNLLANAVKFTAHGSVSLDVELIEHVADVATVRFRVADTGIGIPKDAVGTIFDEYQQGAADTAMRYGGTGLGLSICRKALAIASSQIQVASEPGQGSRFWFELRLPVANVDTEHRAAV